MDHYITQINIDELRHLSNICIPLNLEKRMNLLLTGKNGSGKTTVLRAIKKYLAVFIDGKVVDLEKNFPQWVDNAKKEIKNAKNESERYNATNNYQTYLSYIKRYKDGIDIVFNSKDGIDGLYKAGKFIFAYYGADRKTGMVKQKSAEDVVLETSYSLDSNPGNVLLKYLVHLKTQQAYARNENDMGTVEMLDIWFSRFVKALKVLLDNESIELKYDYKNYNFQIIEDGRNAFGFDQLSDGYSAAIQIVADLILRMEQNWLKKGEISSYDVEGIVLIDELETHLHIGLQKSILPFLTEFFPKIQFVVTTHSPYILNSIENCVRDRFLFRNFFQKIKRYEQLVSTENLSDDERAERATLKAELRR